MNQEVKKKWLEALPTYNKTVGRLRRGDCYCAFGVLCDLYAQEHNNGRWQWNEAISGWIFMARMGKTYTAPDPVLEWAGINPLGEIQANITNHSDKSETWDKVIKYIESL